MDKQVIWQLFDKELRRIENPYVRNTAIALLEIAPAHMATVPSSSTGKYHPEDEFSEGGQILHIRRVVRVLLDLFEMEGAHDITTDFAIAAALIHDMAQYGQDEQRTKYSVSTHEWDLLEMIPQKLDDLKRPYLMEITRLAYLHAGRWGPPFREMDLSQVEEHGASLLHIADVLASRRHIHVEPL